MQSSHAGRSTNPSGSLYQFQHPPNIPTATCVIQHRIAKARIHEDRADEPAGMLDHLQAYTLASRKHKEKTIQVGGLRSILRMDSYYPIGYAWALQVRESSSERLLDGSSFLNKQRHRCQLSMNVARITGPRPRPACWNTQPRITLQARNAMEPGGTLYKLCRIPLPSPNLRGLADASP
ncbi:hypothetical protein K491DRAFT_241106 [Lophiostoma macrostomum CBS 122681]|uniref:Uncharacterized protein n=1 Tax=Lophiostoma macrostomum CBS 122681 TaxID=1314788 RepID=A0A6A6SQA0_9PLEO|nr:hypothetical protein K491DRAFT_241106 [Lophiostoma macrostomum CBS 122681]